MTFPQSPSSLLLLSLLLLFLPRHPGRAAIVGEWSVVAVDMSYYKLQVTNSKNSTISTHLNYRFGSDIYRIGFVCLDMGDGGWWEWVEVEAGGVGVDDDGAEEQEG